jgi:hypothetical protein
MVLRKNWPVLLLLLLLCLSGKWVLQGTLSATMRYFPGYLSYQ